MGITAAQDRFRHMLRAPEKHAYEEKCNRSHHCVAKYSDIPDIVPKPDVHIRKWHADQPCETQDTTTIRRIRTVVSSLPRLNTGAAKSIARAKNTSHARMSNV